MGSGGRGFVGGGGRGFVGVGGRGFVGGWGGGSRLWMDEPLPEHLQVDL